MARGGPAHAAQAAAYRPARARTACGGMRLRRQLFVGATLGQAMAATPPGRGRGIQRAGMGAGQRAGRFRTGPGRGRGRGTDRAFPRGLVPVLEHAVRGRAARRDRGMRVPWPEPGVLPRRDGPPRAGVRQRHRGRAAAGPTGPSPRRGCSRCSARITASRRGSATRAPGTRRAARRTRSASCAAT